MDSIPGDFGVVIIAIFIFFVPFLDQVRTYLSSSWMNIFGGVMELKKYVTLPFVKRLTVCVHLKAVHLLILLTFFAKVSDPYIHFVMIF